MVMMLKLAAAAAAMIVLSAGAVQADTAKLPEGFLLLEAKAKGPKKSWESWSISDKRTAPMQLNPCFVGHWDKGRLEARTITYTGDAYEYAYEQVIVYKEAHFAEEAMNGLRAQLKKCAEVGKGIERYRYWNKPLDLGDEGLRAGGRFFESGEQAVAVRRGAALLIYGEGGYPSKSLPLKTFRPLIKLATEMNDKVCELPEASC